MCDNSSMNDNSLKLEKGEIALHMLMKDAKIERRNKELKRMRCLNNLLMCRLKQSEKNKNSLIVKVRYLASKVQCNELEFIDKE